MTEKIQKDCGYLVMRDGKVYDYEGGSTENGWVYKDEEAFKTGQGVCYISEYGLEEMNENLTDLQARYENSDMSDEEYFAERAKILENAGETRQTIIDQVREAFGDDYLMTDEQVEEYARDVFGLADWAYICTYLQENFDIDDSIEYDHDHGTGVFTKFQYEAIMNGMTPKEYSERQLSYGELAELDEEFDTAFKVDDDCIDDWSDKGLGANARITYIEQRRTGEISGPEEFDCPAQFIK